MRPALAALLNYPIDYAGLFPPAEHPMAKAVEEYFSLDGDEAWLVDRFVCTVPRLGELDAELRRTGVKEAIEVTVVGAPKTDPAAMAPAFRDDWQTATGLALVAPQVYEVKVTATASEGAAKALGKVGIADAVQAFLEFGWDEEWREAMHGVPLGHEEVGFKARTGGVVPGAFPDVPDLAGFIYLAASLESPFKFTAGLHEPLRYLDTKLNVWRHGFLNVLCASAAAINHNLTDREIGDILSVTDTDDLKIGDETVTVCGQVLSMEDLETLWDWCGGFGSCSVQEPLTGLRRLGYLTS